ncbi:MAG: amidohydrolase/deacetylase family metallohydrolase [Candidatus Latescibacterota bacterium]
MKRRGFITKAVAGGAVLGGTAGMLSPRSILAKSEAHPSASEAHLSKTGRREVIISQTGKYELLLKGAHVIDSANGVNSRMDVAVDGGKIAAAGTNIPQAEARRTVDLSGLYLTPGFLDIHLHCFYTDDPPGWRWIIADDLCLPSCVTTCVDVGSSGAGTFEQFKKLIDRSPMRILALINNSFTGMHEGEQDPAQFKIEPMVEIAQTYPKIIVGFKTAHYWPSKPYDSLHAPWAAVDAVVEAGRRANLPAMFDFAPRPASGGYPERSYRELILKRGRPGDIHTHVFSPSIPTVTPEGKVNPDLFKARERGFVFDLGHGGGSFVFKHAAPCIEQGFLPNSISTDLHQISLRNGTVNMANVMSKMMSLGVSLENVIRMSTVNPARIINRPDLGDIKVGNTADIAVFEVQKGNFSFVDVGGAKNFGDRRIQPLMTIFGGKILFDPAGLSKPCWETIPKNDSYWNPPVQPW